MLAQRAKKPKKPPEVADPTKPTLNFPDQWRVADPSQHQELVDKVYIPGTPVGFVERNLADLIESGAPLNIPGGPPNAKTFQYYLDKTIDGYNANAALWYSDLGRLAESQLGKANVEEFAHAWSAFSPQKAPEQNFQEAVAAMLAGRRNPNLIAALQNGDESVLPALRAEFHKTGILSNKGKVGKAFVTNEQIDKVMKSLADHEKRSGGFKTRNFEGDTSSVVTGEYRTGSTQDRHQAGFYEYDKDVISGPGEFRWSMAVTNAIAHKLGISSKQAQAAQWYIQKFGKGHGDQGGFKSVEDAIGHLTPAMEAEIKGASPMWSGSARGTQLSADTRKMSGDFPISTPGGLSEAAGRRNAANVIVESRPSFTLAPEMANLPDAMQELLNKKLMDAVFPGGQNKAYNALDITHRTGAGAGSFEGNVSPNYGVSVLGGSMPKANLVGAIEGKLNLQDAVAIIKPDFFDKEGSILATFNPGPLSRQSLEELKDRLSKEGLDFTLKPDGEIVIGNFDDNADFGAIVKGLEGEYGKARKTGSSGAYQVRSADLPVAGEKNLYETGFGSYDEAIGLARNRIVPAGRQDLRRVVRDTLVKPRVAAYDEIAKNAGIDPRPVRRQVVAAGKDVLDRLWLTQKEQGKIKGLYDRITNEITLIKGNADISTVIHENGHALKEILLKGEDGDLIRRLYGDSADVKGHERFARHLENYFRTGKAPDAKLAQVFESIKTWMRDIYTKAIGGKVDPVVKAIFDRVYGKSDAQTDAFLKQVGTKEFPKVTPESVGVKSGIEPTPATGGTRTRASKAEPTPVAPTAGEPPVVAPPKQTTTPSAEPQTTGVSNRAQLSDAEKGLLMEDPKGKGRSAEDIYNANRNRTDYQNVAAEVAKGRPFSSDDAAAVIAGNRTLTAKVKDAADELDHAINNKQSQSIIDQRREALRSALEEKQQFVDNIQKGKSQWSDTGRVFGLDTRIDNGDIGQVLGEARRWKGSDLNSKEVAQLTKAVEEHARRVKVVEAELKAAQEKIAEKATQNMRAKAGPRPTPDRIADIRKRRADASQRLSRSFGQMNLGIPTETVGAIYDIAKTYVEEYGIVKPQELIKRMRDDHAALKGISDADILESIATAGNPGRVAKTRSEAAQNLAQLRKEAAAAMGNPEKIKAINAKIADLEDQISTGNFKMPKARTKAAPGSELELAQIRLQESRARVNATIRAREPKSAGQKVAGFLRETALANPIARLQDLNSNLWSAADNATWSPVDRALANRISKSAGGEGVAGKVGWNKTRNERVFRNYGASIKAEMAGSNSKFLSDGHYLKPSTWAGATDAPFRVAYERGAWSDLADSFAKRTGKDSESAFRQLVNEEYTPGPMNHADWKAGREAGTKIADRLTYNNDNAASALSSKVKEAIRHYQKHGTPSQQATAQYMEPAVDNILRFSKVIYNVAADRLQRSGQGVVKGASRHIRGIKAAEAMTTEEAMHIARLYRKGATGALTTYAAYLYAKYQMPDGQTGSQHFPGELVKTKSGKVYVDFGSFEQISVLAPILFGVGIARLEKLPTHDGKTDKGGEGVTEGQKKDAWLNMLTDLVTNQPLFSGPERIIKATQSESGMKGYAASVALGAIPGASAIRGIANLVDESKGIRYRSAQTPMDKAKLLLPWWMRDEVAPAENTLPERLRK
jgi:hypothetical protein